MKKKIFITANTAWSIYNFRKNLLCTLSKVADLTVIAPNDEFSKKITEEFGIKTVNLPIDPKGTSPVKETKTLGFYLNFYRKNCPDFIISYTIKPNIYSSIAAKFLGIPCLAVTTGLGYTVTHKSLLTQITNYLYKFAFLHPNEVWFLNQDDKNYFIQNKLVSPHKAKILDGEGVDSHFFSNHGSPQKKHDNNINFLLISRMLKDKGIVEFVQAAQIIKSQFENVTFQLLGSCEAKNPSAIDLDQVMEWEKKGLITYLGTTKDVRPYINFADCIVLPSYREGIPRSLLEAASMEKPIIATDTTGCKDVVIPNVSGFLCKPRSSQDLADTIKKFLLLTKQEKELMGQAGRNFITERFEEKIIIEQYIHSLKKWGVITN